MVYVDDYNAPLGRMKMSHMTADSLDELHQMAEHLGLKRAWFQSGRYPHYDVSQAKRQLAIGLGAQVVSSREIVRIALKLSGEPSLAEKLRGLPK